MCSQGFRQKFHSVFTVVHVLKNLLACLTLKAIGVGNETFLHLSNSKNPSAKFTQLFYSISVQMKTKGLILHPSKKQES